MLFVKYVSTSRLLSVNFTNTTFLTFKLNDRFIYHISTDICINYIQVLKSAKMEFDIAPGRALEAMEKG